MKSPVGIEQHQCLICLKNYDTGAILLDQLMRDRFDHTVVTGHGHCPKCQGLLNDGMIALIEAADGAIPKGSTAPVDTPRSGNHAFIKIAAFEQIFNVPPPEGKVAFVEHGIIGYLQRITEQQQNQGNENAP